MSIANKNCQYVIKQIKTTSGKNYVWLEIDQRTKSSEQNLNLQNMTWKTDLTETTATHALKKKKSS